ncbi:MAG: TIGR01906 family membrane protein [Chloroflexota bacterium]|nr:TIGR01906 family membrane protein [Chloroflexota bacterium]
MSEIATSLSASSAPRSPSLIRLGARLLTVLTPPLLCLIAVRLVMTPLFLQFEYFRPDFPADPYGLTTDDRMRYAPFALDFLVQGQPLDALGDLTFPDGSRQYNQNELVHMRDVQTVTQIAFIVAVVIGIGWMAIAVWLFRQQRIVIGNALRQSAIATWSVIVVIVLFSVVAWDQFFVLFHQLLFSEGTWIFPYSDTLIRLFPERFWFDAAIVIGVLVIAAAALLYGIGSVLRVERTQPR